MVFLIFFIPTFVTYLLGAPKVQQISKANTDFEVHKSDTLDKSQ
jgi:hypothetical protein